MTTSLRSKPLCREPAPNPANTRGPKPQPYVALLGLQRTLSYIFMVLGWTSSESREERQWVGGYDLVHNIIQCAYMYGTVGSTQQKAAASAQTPSIQYLWNSRGMNRRPLNEGAQLICLGSPSCILSRLRLGPAMRLIVALIT